jgi:hypothetical protein
VFEITDGGKYVGEYKQDKREGRGVQTTSKNEKYDGDWIDDKYNGKGSMLNEYRFI